MRKVATGFVGVLAIAISGCATIPQPDDIPDRDDRYTLLKEPLVWKVGRSGRTITVPAGFVSDYASIPPGVSIFLPKRGRYSRAAIVHDYLYWSQKCSRDQADNLMMIGMKETDVKSYQRWFIYTGVDWGGASAWKTNREARQSGSLRILPKGRWAEFGNSSWSAYRAQLESAGVTNAGFSDSGAYCNLGNSRRVPG